MMSDPDWWVTFDYKLTMVVAVMSTLMTVVIGVWRLSKRYSRILHDLSSKVSHEEMAECKSEIVKYIEVAGNECREEMETDRKVNREDHKDILTGLSTMNHLFIAHIDKIK